MIGVACLALNNYSIVHYTAHTLAITVQKMQRPVNHVYNLCISTTGQTGINAPPLAESAAGDSISNNIIIDLVFMHKT